MRRTFMAGTALAALLAVGPALLLPASAAAAAAGPAPVPVNGAPAVVPALQEWAGGKGAVALTDNSRIVIAPNASAELIRTARKLGDDAGELTGLHLTVAIGAPEPGDVQLRIDPTAHFDGVLPRLRDEAYRLDVDAGRVAVTAAGDRGAINAAHTLLQILVSSRDRRSVPVGSAVDYPNYPLRGLMLDVGRRYFTPDFLRSYIRWMGYQKLNTLQIHLNDNEIDPPGGNWSKAQAAFRLRSDNPSFTGLAAQDGAYTKADWDSFEETAAAAGVTLIPEIDAPAHAAAITRFRPDIGLKGKEADHLDLANPEATTFMKSVYSEFAPWFRGPALHIGADEYDGKRVDQYKAYVNTIATHVRGLGKQVHVWGSFAMMPGGSAGYDRDLTVNSWNNGWYGPKQAIADGYDVINSNDQMLYVVPYADYYHGYGFDGREVFESWEPNVFPGGQSLERQDPRLLGAMPAVWNDLVRTPYTEIEVHGLIEKSMAALAQKMWSGTKAGSDYRSFLKTVRAVGQGPGTGYLPDTLGSNDVTSDLARGRTTTASSTESPRFQAGNATDGIAETRWSSARTDDESLTVDLGSVRRIASATLAWEAAYARDYDLRVSKDGTDWTTVAGRRGLTAPATDEISFAAADARYVRMQGIARGTPYGYSLHEIQVRGAADLAAGRPATASSEETTGLTADLAFDNDGATRWSSAYGDPQWVQVDLGSGRTVSRAALTWEAAYAKDYDLQVSTDGTTWSTVARRRNRTSAGTDDLDFTPTRARYVRMQGITRGTAYGYSLYGFRVN
ncbi:discoidin domain-containing protein [Streptomyces sp. NPDC059104]|uniref:discoidin domain-containing protein n=1 Tax=Streptomyces sp. NPDC059104 TaxID=3346729 RepID=UPI003696CC85